MRAIFQWKIGGRVLELGRRTLIMGIVNVTPDSFSDGGLFVDASKAVAHAERLLDEGASISASQKWGHFAASSCPLIVSNSSLSFST